MEETHWAAITLPPGEFDQCQRSLTLSCTHGLLEGQATASQSIASYHLDLPPEAGVCSV
jgi:hypothetical protein